MRIRAVVAMAVVAMAAPFVLTGCSWREAVCRSEEYPAKQVGGTTGAICVPKGEDPPSGYVRYPKGKEPKYVGDKWDKYWSNQVVDKNGNICKETSDQFAQC